MASNAAQPASFTDSPLARPSSNAMEAVKVTEIANRDFNAISDGQRQRVLLARAICQQPEIIILDEPTSFLDIRHKLQLLSILRTMAKQKGITVIALTSMVYASKVDPVHESGKKLHEFVTLALDNCAPAAEAMLEVEGLEAHFAASSGIASDYIMWSLTSVCVEKMLRDGFTPGILKSANFPGGNDYNKTVIEPHYDEFGW